MGTRSPEGPIVGSREHQEIGIRDADRLSGSSRRSRKVVPQEPTTIINNTTVNHLHRSDGTRVHRYTAVRPSRVVYHDRPHMVRHTCRYDHVYRDYHHRLHHRIVWPGYRFRVHYGCGPWFTFRYVYPYYHRKYLFISLGGYWPLRYRYVRYYWYGCHPYHWYGYYPIAREVQGDTYNYYTYNYYDEPSRVAEPEIFENLADQVAEPDQATLADAYFEEAVKVFEAGSYGKAVEKFARAMELAPDDMILPFAYSQALLANGQYSKAAEVLRAALAKVRPDKEGV
ncbi:MAG: tetratricopeptide repeat protein, partial [Phycisphaerales bacterium]